jgi:polar amino acid transport system substrate-binding protein
LWLQTVAFLIVFFILSAPAQSGEKLVLKAVTVEDNFPYNFLQGKQIQGLGFDVATQLAERTGYRLSAEIVPWSGALLTAQNVPVVLLFSVARTPERENNFYWIGPIVISEEWLYKLSIRTELVVKNLNDVKRYRVGIVAHNASIPIFERIGANLDTAPDDRSNCRKLKYGRVDFVTSSPEGLVRCFALAHVRRMPSRRTACSQVRSNLVS